jgi:hypothetical protein
VEASAPKFSVQPNKLGFYSQLRRTVEKIPQTMKGVDLYKYLSDPKRGVKAEELKWTGLDDFLRERAGQKVTPQDVKAFLDQNEVQVQEVTLADRNKGQTKTPEQWLEESAREERIAQQWQRNGDERQAQVHFERAEEANRFAEGLNPDTAGTGGMPKFSQYTLPGGENYREVLLTLPQKARPNADIAKLEAAAKAAGEAWRASPNDRRLEREMDDAQDRVRQAFADSSRSPEGFRGGHFDEPNAIAAFGHSCCSD